MNTQRFFSRKPAPATATLHKASELVHLPRVGGRFTNLRMRVWNAVTFILLLMFYLAGKAVARIGTWKHTPKALTEKLRQPLIGVYTKATTLFDLHKQGTISRVDLIELSLRNMKAKKTRTWVTIGGMMIGIGTIVFLVSIGYGLQDLVITRVARLEEMRQAEVSPQTGGKVKITDETLNNFKDVSHLESALPLIAVVGRISYQNSASDMAVYGVTTEYLKQSAIKPIQGEIFDSNELSMAVPQTGGGQVAGVMTERGSMGQTGEAIQDVDFGIAPDTWVRVREKPSATAKLLGYTRRVEGNSSGQEVWGAEYKSEDGFGAFGQTEEGASLGVWIKAPVRLWKLETCDVLTQNDCEYGTHMVMRDDEGAPLQREGYFAKINVETTGVHIQESGRVLGVSTDGQVLAETDETIDWVEVASESGVAQTQATTTIELPASAKRQAVVNRAMLKVMGIKEEEAVGKVFQASFVVVGDLLANQEEKIESAPSDYTIVGVTPEERTPVFYVPFMDLRSLGVTNYSQVKVVVDKQADLANARKQIESMGYITRSVTDTVAQITALFGTVRAILAVLGMVALSVAALGMFNTLTVSLLERTREVGLMKAMGMKSSEVQELFLTESMIMGFFGGILGIILGSIVGKILSIILSLFTVFRGAGFVDVSHVPFSFVLIIVFLSFLVGIATGIYPARRATKISALNALRYE